MADPAAAAWLLGALEGRAKQEMLSMGAEEVNTLAKSSPSWNSTGENIATRPPLLGRSSGASRVSEEGHQALHSRECKRNIRRCHQRGPPLAHHSQLRFLSREGDSCYHQQVQLRPGQLGLVQELSGNAEINVGDADLDEVNRRIVSSILEAAREAIPVTGGGLSRSNSNPWWNKEREEAVRVKRVMHRHYSKDQNAETHERMKAANRDCNKIIAQAKKDNWIAFADSISAGKADLGSVWKKIRRMKQQCVVPDSDLQHGSTKYTTAQSKADALAKTFAEASLPADRQQFRREMEATFTQPVPDDSLTVNTPLTCSKLRRSLASIKKVKVSTGVDTHTKKHRLVSDAEKGSRVVSDDPDGFLPKMLGWGHNTRGVETRHCRPHPQTRQTEEGARQLQTHLPDIPPRENVRAGDQEPTRIPL